MAAPAPSAKNVGSTLNAPRDAAETPSTLVGALVIFPKLLLKNADTRAEAPAIREKDYRIWLTWSWAEVADEIRALSCGLAALGLKRGGKVAIVGEDVIVEIVQPGTGDPVPEDDGDDGGEVGEEARSYD